jgi:hypothetical protein
MPARPDSIREWGHFRSSKWLPVGPDQLVIPTRPMNVGEAGGWAPPQDGAGDVVTGVVQVAHEVAAGPRVANSRILV